MPTLTVQSAEVRTATVEIKTLTISGRQVTLSVFRQLRERPVIGDDGLTLNGVPWGVVEYHPDPKACPAGDHLHVIWSRGSELFRDAVPVRRPTLSTYPKPRHGAAYVDALLRDQLSQGSLLEERTGDGWYVDVAGVSVRLPLGERARWAMFARQELDSMLERAAAYEADAWGSVACTIYVPSRVGSRRPEALKTTVSAAVRHHWHVLEVALADLGDEPVERAHLRLVAEVEEEAARRRQEAALYRSLVELPQLFIAV